MRSPRIIIEAASPEEVVKEAVQVATFALKIAEMYSKPYQVGN